MVKEEEMFGGELRVISIAIIVDSYGKMEYKCLASEICVTKQRREGIIVYELTSCSSNTKALKQCRTHRLHFCSLFDTIISFKEPKLVFKLI
jgi:hypothetical protein